MTSRFLVLALILTLALAGCGLFGNSEKERATNSRGATPEAIAPEQLASVLPRLEGWSRTEPEKSLTTEGQAQLSRAAATYTSQVNDAAASFTLEVLDGTHVPAVNSKLAVLFHSVQDVHTLKLEVGGHTGVQKWSTSPSGVNAVLVVGNRFVVSLTGTGIEPETVHEAMQATDLRRLQSWAQPGVSSGSGNP